MNKTRVLAVLLCLVFVGTTLGACATGNNAATTAPAATTAGAATGAPAATDAPAPTEDTSNKLSLPFEETLTISYWQSFGAKFAAKISSFSEMPFFKWIEEQANVKFDWTEPSEGSEKEQFGLMIASNDYPDIIQHFAQYYAGGVAAGYDDGIVVNLDPYLTDYMPNLSAFYANFPEFEQQALYQDSTHLTIPHFRNDGSLYSNGLILRKDILDENGWAVPATLAEFEELLYNFKGIGVQIPFSGKGVQPLVWNGTGIMSAYNIRGNEYQDGATHTVKFGALQPEYKEALTVLNKWYADGLLDSDFITNDTAIQNSKIANGLVGSWYGAGNGDGVIPWMAAVDADPDTTMYVLGITGLAGTLGDGPKTVDRADGNYAPSSSAILSSTCKNPEKVLLTMDFMGYSPEGIRAMLYGVEGVHYVIDSDGIINPYVDVDGSAKKKWEVEGSYTWEPLWTEMGAAHLFGVYNFEDHTFAHPEDTATIVRPRWYSPSDTSIETKKNIYSATRRSTWIPNWMNGNFTNNLPQLVFTVDMSLTRQEYYTAIQTYVLENATAFIIGQRPLSEFDDFVAAVNGMGVDKVLADIQTLVDEYYSR